MLTIDEERELLNILENGLSKNSNKIDKKVENRVLLYIKELVKWSKKINLTAIKDPKEIIVKHFLDSLICLNEIKGRQKKVLDLGTGAGFPGLPIKIFNPELSMSLLESTGKKVLFLRHLLDKLKLMDVVVLHGRAEEISKKAEYNGSFNTVVVRAVGKLDLLIKLSFPFLEKNGYLLALKGTNIDEEIKNSEKMLLKRSGKIEAVKEYDLISGKKGKIVKIRKI